MYVYLYVQVYQMGFLRIKDMCERLLLDVEILRQWVMTTGLLFCIIYCITQALIYLSILHVPLSILCRFHCLALLFMKRHHKLLYSFKYIFVSVVITFVFQGLDLFRVFPNAFPWPCERQARRSAGHVFDIRSGKGMGAILLVVCLLIILPYLLSIPYSVSLSFSLSLSLSLSRSLPGIA